MDIELINLGTPNAGDGDTVRQAFQKINGNFEEFVAELGGINNALNSIQTGNLNLDLSAVSQNIIPDIDNVRYLGSLEKQWHSLYVGPGSVFIDGVELSYAAGSLTVSNNGQPVNLNVAGTINAINPVTGLVEPVQGIPAGGAAGQLLVKTTNTDYDATWIDPAINYQLPVASSGTLGGVKIGANVNIDGNGTISVSKGAGINTVADITDVNSTAGGAALNDGALLIYNASSQRWDTINNLRSDEMDGGFF